MKELPSTLTKENFFNAIQEMNPEGMKKFCDWIDEYKQKVCWSNLFRAHAVPIPDSGYRLPKYHELPIAMQIGIFIQFMDEKRHTNYMPLLISLFRTELLAYDERMP